MLTRVGMNFGHTIATNIISNLFGHETVGNGELLRPSRGAKRTRSSRPQGCSNSFAAHPERW